MTDPIIDPSWSDPGYFLARVRRPDGTEVLLRIPDEHYHRVEALAEGEFRDTSIRALTKKHGTR